MQITSHIEWQLMVETFTVIVLIHKGCARRLIQPQISEQIHYVAAVFLLFYILIK